MQFLERMGSFMLTRKNTKQLKGMAVLLMLTHHLFTFPDRVPFGLNLTNNIILNETIISLIGKFGQICVPIFMFLGGYGLYASCVSKEKDEIRNDLVNKIINLYKSYWKVFLIFVPIGILFFSKQPHFSNADFGSSFYNISGYKIISTFLGIESCFNYEWWFFKSYLFALFEGFIFLELFLKNKNRYLEIVCVILWYITISSFLQSIISLNNLSNLVNNFWYSNLFSISSYSVLFFMGIIFSKYDIFQYWNDFIENLAIVEKIVIALFVLSFCLYIKSTIITSNLDILLVPIVCFTTLMLINSISILSKILFFIGKNSTNMWLTHTFYCYYFYPFVKIVYGSRNALVAFITLVILSLITSILIDIFWKYISKLYNQIHMFLLSKGY